MIGALLRAPAGAVTRHIASSFAAEFPDLRLAHLTVFQHLDHPPGGNRLTVLAERCNLSKQALIELIDPLERAGYVERAPDPTDRRAKIIRMTPTGWAVHARAFEVVGALQSEWERLLGPAKFRQLFELLVELNDRLGFDKRHG